MKVLIGCEYSGTVRDAFIAQGHEAISCDLLPTDIEGPHYQGDIFDLLTLEHEWDLIILHPPCTALAVSGNRHYGKDKPKHSDRLKSMRWTLGLWCKAIEVCDRVALENPVGVLTKLPTLPKPQYIQPYQFGHPEKKKTGLFLHNLPPLQKTSNVYEEMLLLPKKDAQRIHYLPPSSDRWKIRSKTYQGIADAMSKQWCI